MELRGRPLKLHLKMTQKRLRIVDLKSQDFSFGIKQKGLAHQIRGQTGFEVF